MTKLTGQYERSEEDGLYHCDIEGCEQPGYEHPQHLGLHRFHQHGIKGTSRNPDGTPKKSGKRGRPPKNQTGPLSADDICRTALELVAPNGSIPISAIPSYNAWVEQTRAFFVYLLG